MLFMCMFSAGLDRCMLRLGHQWIQRADVGVQSRVPSHMNGVSSLSYKGGLILAVGLRWFVCQGWSRIVKQSGKHGSCVGEFSDLFPLSLSFLVCCLLVGAYQCA